MQIEKFSKKQAEVIKFAYSNEGVLICDGAVRSGKTIVMSFAFVLWAMENFDKTNFAICGKTVSNAERNILRPFQQIDGMPFKMQYKISTRMLTVRCADRENYFYLFGGKDESSQALIQGLTLAGVLFDEVALMPKSFVDQAIARTLSFKNAKLWFNCNPESPNHWFYKEWITDVKKPKKHLHFLMRDNPILGDAEIARAESFFAGVFYQRFILGEWVLSDGLVYDFGEDNITDEVPEHGEYYMSIDYGTQNPFSCGLWCVVGDNATRIAEYYYCGRNEQTQKTDEEYCDEVEKLAKGYKIKRVVVDPSAASFIASLRKRGFYVTKANNDVLDGIRRVSGYLKNGKLKIHRSCGHTVEEFGLYRWDDKSGEDKVVKENDHCLTGDTVVNTIWGGRKIKDLVGNFGFVWSYDEKRKKKCIRPFFGVKKTRENQPILKITLENGKVVRCTPDHRILTDSGWIEAKYLTQSSKIIDIDCSNLVSVDKVEIEPNDDVYNMEVIGTHNFAVNGGVIVHNCMDDIRYFVNTVLRHKSGNNNNTFWKEW